MSDFYAWDEDRLYKARLSDQIHQIHQEFLKRQSQTKNAETRAELARVMNEDIQRICLQEIERMEAKGGRL